MQSSFQYISTCHWNIYFDSEVGKRFGLLSIDTDEMSLFAFASLYPIKIHDDHSKGSMSLLFWGLCNTSIFWEFLQTAIRHFGNFDYTRDKFSSPNRLSALLLDWYSNLMYLNDIILIVLEHFLNILNEIIRENIEKKILGIVRY